MSGDFPCSENSILVFIAWNLDRGISSGTVSSYLSGIRSCHLTRGLNPPSIHSPLVTSILSGQLHRDQINKRLGLKKTRLPVTPIMLRLFKAELKASSLHPVDKLLTWAVAVLAFLGGFRIHELLSTHVNSFDPSCTLLASDIKLITVSVGNSTTETIQILLKSEKTDKKGQGTLVDVYATKSELCPVKALKKWRTHSSFTDPSLPAFRLASGKCLTGSTFNKYLKSYLGKHVNSDSSFISSHSFRSGIATLIGQLGFADEDLKSLGRWSSSAYTTYLKLPRTRRLEMAKSLSNILT